MKFIVYSMNNCNFCKKQKEFLHGNNIEFEEKVIDNNERNFEDFKNLKGLGVPLTIIEEKGVVIQRIDGYNEKRFSPYIKIKN